MPRMLFRAYLDAWKKPGQVLDMARQLVPAVKRIRKAEEEQAFHYLEDKQKTRFQGKISPHRVVEARKFDFEEIRAIKNTVPGVTINDVMLTVVAGALRKYLQSKDELPEKSLVSGCPIDVRSPEERSAGGNMVGFMNVGLCTDIEDPAQRLAAVHRESLSAKAFAEALGPRVMVDLTDVMPGNVLSLAMRAATATGLAEANTTMNTIVTNVPGAPFQLYLCGAELIDSFSLGPLVPGCGLFHIVYSAVQNKKGTITLSFTACRDQMPDPEFYAQCLQASFDELKAATLTAPQGKPGRKPAKKKKSTARRRTGAGA